MNEKIKKWRRPGSIALLTIAALFFSLMPTGSAAIQNDSRPLIAGPITSLPNTQNQIGEWLVIRTKVKVTDATKIDQTHGKVAVGALVEVKGVKQNDGSILASEIVVKLSPGSGLPITFSGKIDELPSTPSRVGDWKVLGRTVHVTTATKIDQSKGQVAAGVFVEVEGLIQLDGSINAIEIEVKPDGVTGIPVKFLGKVEKLPSTTGRIGEWVISGRKVNVTAQTTQRGEVMIGSWVDLEGVVQLDGSITATKIELRPSIDPPVLNVTFKGTVEVLPNTATFIGDWKVSGRKVIVTDKTALNQDRGKPAVGATVEVSGVLANDGSVAASKVTVSTSPVPGAIRFTGLVSILPPSNGIVPGFIGDWKVGERVVHVVVA